MTEGSASRLTKSISPIPLKRRTRIGSIEQHALNKVPIRGNLMIVDLQVELDHP